MATDTLSTESLLPADARIELGPIANAVLAPFASLRLTVALFALSIFIIFVGTLAQVEKDMWEVIDLYFRSYVAWIDLQLFFPSTWFPSLAGKVPGTFPVPGGFTVGVLMAANLVAAHLVRFKTQAKGPELAIGLAIIAVGVIVTYFVIAAGHNQGGLQGQPPFTWTTFWMAVRGGLFLVAIAGVCTLAFSQDKSMLQRMWILGPAILCGGLGVWAATTMPSPSSLRILWQLIQGGFAGVVLLVGCLFAFKKRAGIVLLHAGIGLMMFSEFFVSQYAVEGRMTISEGETINYLRDIREAELAVIDRSSDETDHVTVVPATRLVHQNALWLPGAKSESNGPVLISDDQLPFDIRVDEFIKNADLVDLKPDESGYANQGVGKQLRAREIRASSGTDGGEVDMAAVHVEFRKKGSNDSLGKYLLSQIVAANDRFDQVEVDGKSYDVALRFKRSYKPYAIALKDVRKDDYLGTNTPMNYSSDVVLTDAGTKVGEFKIWMNNPLRYAGETFYQSGYNDIGGREITDLQVVTNTGWMMPYVGCMLVGIGMMVHFSMTLWRFLSRLLRQDAKAPVTNTGWKAYVIPALIVLIFSGYVGSKMRPPTDTKANMRLHEFGALPVVYQGRVKPMDTLARNTLRIISNKETFDDETKEPSRLSRRKPQLPAIRWLLDVMSGAPEAKTHKVFRIDNLDVLETLDLPRRKGFRYAEVEFQDKIPELERQLEETRQLEPEARSFYQRKLLEVERRIRAVRLIEAAFARIFPPLPTEEEFNNNREEAMARIQQIKMLMSNSDRLQAMLERMQPPLAVPVESGNDWLAFSTAWNVAYAAQYSPDEIDVPQATLLWDDMLRGYAASETKTFNDAVRDYRSLLAEETPENVNQSKVGFEHFFNHFRPFSYAKVLYIVSFVLVATGWLNASNSYFPTINRSAFWLLVFTFALHTFALASRVYISGRPPVTNLYSSAVFIGWAAVGLGLILELVYGMGIGNAKAAIAGFSTLQIAYALAADGDTFTVLQAVLDTQFWLATHVVCITLGYATTFAAGKLGIIYILAGGWMRPSFGKALSSMIYGTLCFAILFSFIGTVLGGLWADDSWGRFWGWDPKENGALMIVLWNALVLHARWGGMIKGKGLALLSIVGNIITAWSWFGVNELGVGLHSYGFTEGVLLTLGLYVGSQLAIMLFGGIAIYLLRDSPANAKVAS